MDKFVLITPKSKDSTKRKKSDSESEGEHAEPAAKSAKGSFSDQLEKGLQAVDRDDVNVNANKDWSELDVKRLFLLVESYLSWGDSRPHFEAEKSVDFNSLAFGSYTGEECRRKYWEVCSRRRLYRTWYEVHCDVFSDTDVPSREQVKIEKSNAKIWGNTEFGPLLNSGRNEVRISTQTSGNKNILTGKQAAKSSPGKKKKKVPQHPDMPVKRLTSAYTFFQKKYRENKVGRIDFREMGERWKSLSDKERQPFVEQHQEYLKEYNASLDKFYQNHPEVSRPVVKKKAAPATSTSGKNSKTKNENIDHHDMGKPGTQSVGSPKKKNSSPVKSPTKSVPVQNHAEESGSESESESETGGKKTGLMVYTEKKFKTTKIKHPELTDSQIRAKLKRKFAKMGEFRQAKYEAMANDSGEESY